VPSSAVSAASAPVSTTHGTVRDLLAGSKSGIARKWRHQQPSTIRSGLLRSTTLPASRFSPAAVHPLPSAHTSTADPQTGYDPTTVMNTLSDPPTPSGYGESSDMNCDSPNEMATPTLTHSPSSTDLSSGDQTIQMSSFIDEPHRPVGPMNNIFAPLAMAPAATQKPIMTGDGFPVIHPTTGSAPTNPAHALALEHYGVPMGVPMSAASCFPDSLSVSVCSSTLYIQFSI
jgi:hypothetical protein